jgi:translation initiation factor 3 subunit K
MSSSTEAIQKLLTDSPYSASNQAPLEAHVDAQAKGDAPYFMDANRSLLKLYQFFPQSANESKYALVLLLSLLQFPSTDVLALSYLVPERIQTTEPCATILKCADLLDSCQFEEFWTTLGGIQGDDQCKSLASGSTNRLQATIAEVLALSYRTAALSMVLSALNLKSGDAALVQMACVESVTGDVVTFVATADNTKRNRVFQEGVNFAAISSMMGKVTSE